MGWIYLLLAGAAEIGWMVALKFSDGFSRLLPSIVAVVALALSFAFIAPALRTIPMGTAYAIWTGIGAAGIAIVGILFFDEPATLLRMTCIALVVVGIVGLMLTAA